MKQTEHPIKLMYAAIMQISFVSSDFFTERQALARVKEIADATLKDMNMNHTKLIQKHVFGIGVKSCLTNHQR